MFTVYWRSVIFSMYFRLASGPMIGYFSRCLGSILNSCKFLSFRAATFSLFVFFGFETVNVTSNSIVSEFSPQVRGTAISGLILALNIGRIIGSLISTWVSNSGVSATSYLSGFISIIALSISYWFIYRSLK